MCDSVDVSCSVKMYGCEGCFFNVVQFIDKIDPNDLIHLAKHYISPSKSR